jgi:RES domain-containing protein
MDQPFSPDPRLLEALAHLEAHPWSGEVWRHTFGSQPPERTNTRGARWNPPNVEALYTSLDRSTDVAEADHILAVQPIKPRTTRTIHRLRLDLEAVIDLRDPSALASLGLDLGAITGDDCGVCQAIGGAASFLGIDGLIVASARAPGANIVVLFTGTGRFPVIEVISSEAE